MGKIVNREPNHMKNVEQAKVATVPFDAIENEFRLKKGFVSTDAKLKILNPRISSIELKSTIALPHRCWKRHK